MLPLHILHKVQHIANNDRICKHEKVKYTQMHNYLGAVYLF